MMQIRLHPDDLAAIRAEADAGYPEEVCGVLVGHDADGVRTIARIQPVPNSRTDNRARRFTITAEALRDAEREANSTGFDVVGFYHSHPDHPAVPSEYDREHSWPWYTYVIVSVLAGQSGELRAWQLRKDRGGFEEQRIGGEDGVWGWGWGWGTD